MFSIAPSEQRALVRDWLTAPGRGRGLSIELTEPTDYSRWDAELRRWEPS